MHRWAFLTASHGARTACVPARRLRRVPAQGLLRFLSRTIMPRRPRTVASLTAPPLPLDPLVPHLAALLHEVIASQSCDWDAREVIFRALQTLTCVCREARTLAQIDGLRWLCLFEWHAQAHGRAPPRRAPRLCDGLPLWFHLPDECRRAIGPVRARVEAYAQLGVSVPESVKRRRWFARRCAQPNGAFVFPARFIEPDDSQEVAVREAHLDGLIGSPEHHFAPDLDDLVPAPVARFVGFLRWWFTCTLVTDAMSDCKTCSAPGCLRPAKVRDPTPEEADALCEPSYWPRLRSGVAALGAEAAWPCNLPWCSCACEDAGTDEFFRRVHPCSAAELAAPPSATRAVRRTTRISAARLLAASLERNAVVARRMRHERRDAHVPLRWYPLSAGGLRAYHEKLVFALNVDIGVLYAAMLLEGWPLARRPARPLPQTAHWRDDGVSYLGAACAVQRLYRKGGATATLQTSLVTPPRWMGAIKDELEKIF